MLTPNALPCDDSDVCTTDDLCALGECVPGETVDCDDAELCTDDSCDGQIGCIQTPNALPCDDGNACTTADGCTDGSCKSTEATECSDAEPCTDDKCDPQTGCVFEPNTAPCDDLDACTTGDSCAAGSCVGAEAAKCDDDNGCTEDSCDAANG